MSECFLTGCDKNTEWQLPWFIDNYSNHTKTPLIIADFGMSEEMLTSVSSFAHRIITCKANGWFSKIEAMLEAAHQEFNRVCWLDTDCQVMANPKGIFNYVVHNKLTMVKDHPWTKRRPENGDWHNTGVVAFEGRPPTLRQWMSVADKKEHRGDQEVMHAMIGGDAMRKMMMIADAPHRFNVLRLDHIDNNVPENPVIMHWTGEKGKDEIRRQMNSL